MKACNYFNFLKTNISLYYVEARLPGKASSTTDASYQLPGTLNFAARWGIHYHARQPATTTLCWTLLPDDGSCTMQGTVQQPRTLWLLPGEGSNSMHATVQLPHTVGHCSQEIIQYHARDGATTTYGFTLLPVKRSSNTQASVELPRTVWLCRKREYVCLWCNIKNMTTIFKN